MLRAALLCLLVAACSPVPSLRLRLRRPLPDGRIVGGQPVMIWRYPWQLSMQRFGSHICGASIISSTWALTAAHCMEGSYVEAQSLRAGTSTHGSGGTVYDARDAFYHRYYESFTCDYDIGVIEIFGCFSFGTNVKRVCLGTAELAIGTRVTITGWGSLSYGEPLTGQLQAVTTSIVSRDSCDRAYFGGKITDRMICAGEEEGGKDSCMGDSGGPLVVRSTQYGIVSWGWGCGHPEYPGVYSNVAYLCDWIIKQTGLINCKD